MLYLSRFTFPDAEWETGFLMGILRKCYDTFYPFFRENMSCFWHLSFSVFSGRRR